jgi:hypothetical protein
MEVLCSMDIHELAVIEQAIFVEKDESIVSAREYFRQKELEEPKTISLLDLGILNRLLLGVASKEVEKEQGKNFWIVFLVASSYLMVTTCWLLGLETAKDIQKGHGCMLLITKSILATINCG